MTTRGLRTRSRASSEPGNDGGCALGPSDGLESARLAAHPGLPKRISAARRCEARGGCAAEGTQRRRSLGAIRGCTTAPPKAAGRGENGVPLYPQRWQRANQPTGGQLGIPHPALPRKEANSEPSLSYLTEGRSAVDASTLRLAAAP